MSLVYTTSPRDAADAITTASKICRALGYEMNIAEFAIQNGVLYAIDFMSSAPDFDLSSLRDEHFLWMIEQMVNLVIKLGSGPRPGDLVAGADADLRAQARTTGLVSWPLSCDDLCMNAARKLEPTPPFPPDPVLAAFLNAPVSVEPETDEERAAFEVGMADIRAGRTRAISSEEIRATLERMQHAQGE